MNQVKAGLVVGGIIDGTTVVYTPMVVDGLLNSMSLMQVYDASGVDPDFADINRKGTTEADATLPRIIITARDTANSQDITTSLRFSAIYYNGVQLSPTGEGTTSHISNWNKGVKYGTLFESDEVQYKDSYIPCLKVVGNPADPSSNTSDDIISIDGTVVSGSGDMSFSGLEVTFGIREKVSGGQGYRVELVVPTANDAPYAYTDSTGVQPATLVAKLYNNDEEVPIASQANMVFKFYDITGATDVELTTTSGKYSIVADGGVSRKIQILPDGIDFMLSLRVCAYENAAAVAAGSKPLATNVRAVYDLSDDFKIQFSIADNASGTLNKETLVCNRSEYPKVWLRKNQKRYIIPEIVTDSGYSPAVTWTFNADDATTKEPISGLPRDVSSTSCSIQYSDVIVNGANRYVIIHAQSSEF